MRDRAVTAAVAVVVLLVFYTFFFHKTQPVPVTRPVSTETGRNGYAAVATWLERNGVPVASLRRRYDALTASDSHYAARGNILITTMPHLIPTRSRERQILRAWVRTGNTLLVMAALDDTPEWARYGDNRGFLDHLARMTGFVFVPDPGSSNPNGAAGSRGGARKGGPGPAGSGAAGSGGANSGAASPRPAPAPLLVEARSAVKIVPVGSHPLLTGVDALSGFSDEPSALWLLLNVAPAEDSLRLRLAKEVPSGVDALWQRVEGDGRIIVAASGSLLTNHVVANSSAGTFLANLVRKELGQGGTVIFDDMHQGLSVLYDPAAFFRDSRLHVTLLFLAAVWLAYVLGSSNRLGPAAEAEQAPRQRAFLEAVGGFMARRLDKRAAGMLMLEKWFEELRRKRGLPESAEPPWPHLLATPALGRATYDALKRAHEQLESGRQVDLVRLHNLINQARKAIG
ncbi:MAG TPA: DUF4350 domain-containing protein [Gammaproteobacteria bacterium]|nr:DUF4350 domain-containing protein [Gammaproteobacteria bacterium]